ncbi:hypothetical protein [Streptomyces antimycoticus]|uniref:hypothetical protein n=1 Tax=Streptomyces antimycoticus TaxID=68175 RepID=UPI003866F802|nr:hypothetical protein OG751_40445 [Streptomyces antimycoticus]WTB11916.1 hypothetical protein OG546_05870 [Streptomyces antimycoticus]
MKWPKAAKKVTDESDELLAFYDFPAEHWVHLRPRAYNRAGGYDSGGYLQPGLNLAYNGTGRPEPVFTTQQANALLRLGADPAAGLGDLNVAVYVGDRETWRSPATSSRLSRSRSTRTRSAGRPSSTRCSPSVPGDGTATDVSS